MSILNQFMDNFIKESIEVSNIVPQKIYYNLERINDEEFRLTFYMKRNSKKVKKGFPIYKCGMILVNLKEEVIHSYMTWKKSSRWVEPTLRVAIFNIEENIIISYIDDFKIIDKIYNDEY